MTLHARIALSDQVWIISTFIILKTDHFQPNSFSTKGTCAFLQRVKIVELSEINTFKSRKAKISATFLRRYIFQNSVVNQDLQSLHFHFVTKNYTYSPFNYNWKSFIWLFYALFCKFIFKGWFIDRFIWKMKQFN